MRKILANVGETSTKAIAAAARPAFFLDPTEKEVGNAKLACHSLRKTRVSLPVTPALLAAVALFVFNSVNAAAAAAGPTNFCRLTTENALRSCQTGAQSDHWLALAKCDNVSDTAERMDCQKQAQADLKDALQSCNDQRGARNAVCTQLGGAPYDPVIDPLDFSVTITNQYLPMTPGHTFVYESPTERNEVVVTGNTRTILGTDCLEVHDTVKLKASGELTEDTLDWFCQDTAGNVWYFGENTKQLEGGLVVGLEGAWTGGVDGAKPGIAMKASPAVGDVYRQEYLPGVAEDIGEVLSLTESVTLTNFGTLSNCLKTKDTSPLEPGAIEHKFYCPGIGVVRTIDLITGETSDLISKTP
jgi:hypothetical protein